MTTKRAILRTLLALTSACTLTLSVAQEPESSMTRVQRTKVLRVGAIAGAIPYFSKDLVSGKWEGFGPDFSESLAKKFGAKVEYVETTWGNAVLDLQSNKIDAMFGMAPTPARKEVVNFSDTLFDNTYTAVCKKGFPTKSWEQLNAPENRSWSTWAPATTSSPRASCRRPTSSGWRTRAPQRSRCRPAAPTARSW